MNTYEKVLAVQSKFKKLNSSLVWSMQDVDGSLHDPQLAVTAAIGEIEDKQNNLDHYQNKFGQMSVVGFGVGALAFLKFFKFPQIPPITNILKFVIAAKIFSCIDSLEREVLKLSPKFSQLKFLLSGGGGNICGTLLKILEKLHYIEYRLQDAQMLAKDVQRPSFAVV